MSPGPDYLSDYDRKIAARPAYTGRRDHFGGRQRVSGQDRSTKPGEAETHRSLDESVLPPNKQWLRHKAVFMVGGYLMEVVSKPLFVGLGPPETCFVRAIGDIYGPFDPDDERLIPEVHVIAGAYNRFSQRAAEEFLDQFGLEPLDLEERG